MVGDPSSLTVVSLILSSLFFFFFFFCLYCLLVNFVHLIHSEKKEEVIVEGAD